MAAQTFTEFMALYDPDSTRVIADITPVRDADGNSPFVIVRHGPYVAVLALMPFDGSPASTGAHLCIDVHPFVNGQDAAAGVFGMTDGRRVKFPHTGETSHGWPATHGVSVLIGEQAVIPFACSGTTGCRAPDGDENHAHYCLQHSQEASS